MRTDSMYGQSDEEVGREYISASIPAKPDDEQHDEFLAKFGKSPCLSDVFNNTHQSLAELHSLGWIVEQSMGCWWFRNTRTRERQGVPTWIGEMVANARKDGAASAIAGVRASLGLGG